MGYLDLLDRRLAAPESVTNDNQSGIRSQPKPSVKVSGSSKIAGTVPLVPQRRWGTPEDVGRAVRAILAGHFAFTTGDVIHVDGGFHVPRL